MEKIVSSMLITLTLALTFLLNLPTVSAENAKAAEIREILNSKTYYVEYEVNKKEDKRALAVDGNHRKSFDCEGRRSATLLRFIPIVGMFAKGSLKLMPEVYYGDGNYYQFVEKRKALRANEKEMKDPYLNPSQEWNTIPLRIELPEEFAIFTNDDTIKFVESGKKVIDAEKNKEIEFDKYVKFIRNNAGTNIAKKVYFVYYNEKSELDKIMTMTVDLKEDAGTIFAEEENKKPEAQNYEIQTIKIRKITGTLPEKIMEFPNRCKVYAPGLGDMNELLDQPPLLEEFKTLEE